MALTEEIEFDSEGKFILNKSDSFTIKAQVQEEVAEAILRLEPEDVIKVKKELLQDL